MKNIENHLRGLGFTRTENPYGDDWTLGCLTLDIRGPLCNVGIRVAGEETTWLPVPTFRALLAAFTGSSGTAESTAHGS